jgi:hypothetical protein
VSLRLGDEAEHFNGCTGVADANESSVIVVLTIHFTGKSCGGVGVHKISWTQSIDEIICSTSVSLKYTYLVLLIFRVTNSISDNLTITFTSIFPPIHMEIPTWFFFLLQLTCVRAEGSVTNCSNFAKYLVENFVQGPSFVLEWFGFQVQLKKGSGYFANCSNKYTQRHTLMYASQTPCSTSVHLSSSS